MECADAGTYASIVCHYCIDVPKLVCKSICASGLDQTPSNCNWSPWWAWHGLSGAAAQAAAATEGTPPPPRINPHKHLDSARTTLE